MGKKTCLIATQVRAGTEMLMHTRTIRLASRFSKRAVSLVEELVLKRQSEELERQAKALPKKIS